MKIDIEINNKKLSLEVKPDESLVNVLRREGYYEVKAGCHEGYCGACTVLLDGEPVNSCLVLAAKAHKRKITTVSALGSIDSPHPLQQAFVEEGAVQCGFCTPGMILSAKALLDREKNPNEEQIKLALDGNLCRCTGYVKIINAVQKAACVINK